MAFDTVTEHARQILTRLATIVSIILGLPGGTASAFSEESAVLAPEELPATTTGPSQIDASALQSAYQELESAQKICNAACELEPSLGMTYLNVLSGVLSNYEQTKSLPRLIAEMRWARLAVEEQSRPAVPQQAEVIGRIALLARHRTRPKLREPELLEQAFARTEGLFELSCEALDFAVQVVRDLDVDLALEPFVDPESTSGNIAVYVIFISREDVDAGNTILDQFEQLWYAEHGLRAEGRLAFAIDYV